MKSFTAAFLLFIITFLSTSQLFAQQVFQLNKMDSQAKFQVRKTITGAVHERQYYSLNDDPILLSQVKPGDQLELQITPSSTSLVEVTRIVKYTRNTTSFLTREIKNPENTFTFTYSDGRLYGLYHKSHEEIFYFEYDQDVRQNYVAKGSSYHDDHDFCSTHEIDHQPEIFSTLQELSNHSLKGKSISASPSVSAMAASLEDEVTIDVMIPYTKNARAWADSSNFNDPESDIDAIEIVIATAMGLSQTALDNSDIFINLRLVHYYETDYEGDSLESLDEDDPGYVSAEDHLRRLTRNPAAPFPFCSQNDADCNDSDFDGYMEEAHMLRDQFGADVVAAVLSEPNTGGIAFINGSTAGAPFFGFSINRVQQIGSGYTLIHEIGHNMGNVHARNQPQAQAGELGGLFIYSAGKRFTAGENGYATVMAYSSNSFAGIPYFSNPDVNYSGVQTGNRIAFAGEAGPADNARSMREIKRAIAAYRPTVVDPPSADVDLSGVSVNLDQDNKTATVPVTIQNNGSSDLMWEFDFDIESGVIAAKTSSEIGYRDFDTEPLFSSENFANTFGLTNENGEIFTTDFESHAGFSSGDYNALSGWRTRSTSAPFEISNENPSASSQHLRLPRRSGTSNSVFARSPFFGPQPMGEYSISFDMATYNPVSTGNDALFDVYAYDASTATLTAAIIINTSGSLFVRTVAEDGSDTFGFTNMSFPSDSSYHNVEIKFNPNNRSIDYFLDGSMIASNPYPSGRKPDYLHFGNRNNTSGAFMDIDNIVVKKTGTPFNWLTAEKFGGVVKPASSETVHLTLSANDVPTGTYQTVLQVKSNDPAEPVIEIPVTADIEMAVSSEYSVQIPDRVSLSQNYPNPFNPSTTIRFELNRTTDVKLDVYNIAGQKVATLAQEVMNAGAHELSFDAGGLSSGVYFYRLQTPGESLTRQMVLIK